MDERGEDRDDGLGGSWVTAYRTGSVRIPVASVDGSTRTGRVERERGNHDLDVGHVRVLEVFELLLILLLEARRVRRGLKCELGFELADDLVCAA